ncbi:hypothetical protein [Methylorubrum thiocyanatum]|uniref:Uncharacterized protein n=1 Tax=Methylorubrum thiocyanatum TaxID=47958 RepID=A0AA40VBE1_9HYPH|nr:hypothetical protein [Methylorubrum thiocyanatum]MBA8914144.1 hypothetical protein [Methylorubrum thiocyanatum]GJE79109.1 hypothetical protein CJNNKLLH_0434 [Methylorubrum thiocyanatum]
MAHDDPLRSGRLLRRPGPSGTIDAFTGVEVHDVRLETVLAPDAGWEVLYTFTLHGEGPV